MSEAPSSSSNIPSSSSSSSDNTNNLQYYRLGQHLAFGTNNQPPRGRPHGMLSKLSPDTFFATRLKMRFGQTNNMIMLNLFMPLILEWTKIQNELIAENEKYGHIEAPMTDELRLLLGRGLPPLAAMVSHALVEAAMDFAIISDSGENTSNSNFSFATPENRDWRHSIVRLSESQMKIKSHYYANIVEKFYLPRRWTYAFVGPEASAEELEVFTSPVSIGCAFEDYLKRHTVAAIADACVFALGELLNFIPWVKKISATREVFIPPGRLSSRNRTRVQQPPVYVWKEPAAISFKDTMRRIGGRILQNTKHLLVSAIGAGIGSYIGGGRGGAWEFWCSRFAYSIFSIADAQKSLMNVKHEVMKAKEEAERQAEAGSTASRGFEQQQQQARNFETATSSNSNNNNNNNDDEVIEEIDDEERIKYFNQAQLVFADRGAQQQQHQQAMDLQNSPVNAHRPLQKPEQRQIVIEDDDDDQ